MNEHTIESLNKRIEILEAMIGLRQAPTPGNPSIIRPAPGTDWRSVVGMFGDSEFQRQLDEEVRRAREADREAARRGETE
jgi:hypothetical protein